MVTKKQDRVRAVIFLDGRILFIRRERNSGVYYVLPGGGVEDGDSSIQEALKRELWEELRVKEVEVGEQLCSGKCKNRHSEGMQYVFLCKLREKTLLSLCASEFSSDKNSVYQVEWVNIDRVFELDFRPEEIKDVLFKRLKGLQQPELV